MDKFFRGFLYFAFLLSAINLYLSWDFSIQSYNEEKYYSKFFNKLENTYSKYGSINEDEFPYNYDKSKGFYYEACYSPDKKQIATSHSERGIEIFDVDTKELIKKVGNKSAYSIRYSPSCVLRTIRVRNNKHLTNLVANKSILSAFWISIY